MRVLGWAVVYAAAFGLWYCGTPEHGYYPHQHGPNATWIETWLLP